MSKDRDDVVREIVRRDARYRAEGYAFLLEALDFTIQRRGKGRKHVSGPELLEMMRDFEKNLQQTGVREPDLFDTINNLKYIDRTGYILISGVMVCVEDCDQ